ncbi:hypothetical protein BKA61DRAFT_694788 [Leptodontidium sp. MPI-SDFR-AT-0119]|nr:hypothetical protein BKA61DRAFT_694788 [Leptodontidium sp. MPI-SDFR-AT-0119]
MNENNAKQENANLSNGMNGEGEGEGEGEEDEGISADSEMSWRREKISRGSDTIEPAATKQLCSSASDRGPIIKTSPARQLLDQGRADHSGLCSTDAATYSRIGGVQMSSAQRVILQQFIQGLQEFKDRKDGWLQGFPVAPGLGGASVRSTAKLEIWVLQLEINHPARFFRSFIKVMLQYLRSESSEVDAAFVLSQPSPLQGTEQEQNRIHTHKHADSGETANTASDWMLAAVITYLRTSSHYDLIF